MKLERFHPAELLLHNGPAVLARRTHLRKIGYLTEMASDAN